MRREGENSDERNRQDGKVHGAHRVLQRRLRECGFELLLRVSPQVTRQCPGAHHQQTCCRGISQPRIVLSTAPDPRRAAPERRGVLMYDQLDEVVYFHDNPNIDLAAILLRPILDRNVDDGSTIYLDDICLSDFAAEDIESRLRFVEDVLVVGYPRGQWDETRNLPLFRRGITASPAMLDYNGEAKFLIDCSIYPGSSGSPVFLYNFPAYVEDGKVNFGERCALLGAVSSVLAHNVEGTVEEVDIPSAPASLD